MIVLRDKTFNSRAAKALNTKYLKSVAAKNGIPVYESKGFRTTEIDPKVWKKDARFHENYKSPESNRDFFNSIIETKTDGLSASGLTNRVNSFKHQNKGLLTTRYDHGVRDHSKLLDTRKSSVKWAREERLGK